MDLLSGIYGVREDERTIVAEPEVCRKLGTYLTDDNLPLLKEYVKTCLYADLSMITDMESLNAAQEYQMAVSGTEEKKPLAGLYQRLSSRNWDSSAEGCSAGNILTTPPDRM